MTAQIKIDRLAQLAVGLLRPCLLAHLLNRSAYGYELRAQLTLIGLVCDLGTIYRALNTMEDAGLLRSTWETSATGRSRRRYELSESGGEMVDAYVEPVEQLVSVAMAFLDMCAPRSLTGTLLATAEDPVA